uniref:copper chaperone for superoxide dismutase-like isoform X1 n=1 Tax=Styela clava TaxID=7725 RepID=UPI0019393851|nr:copper chaperone for superoxide dismutase-like isoform X1 [Styela clava]XP_039273737.1 copper chaperone for superoxide dismutase-like isoform X2 [Styela clava]
MEHDSVAKLEFVVSMTCNTCVEKVEKVLSGNSKIIGSKINLNIQQVVVDTALPFEDVQKLIESTGMQAELVGIGSSMGKDLEPLGAAVAEIRGNSVKGIVRLAQLTNNLCLIDGIVDGLSPGYHGLNVHTYGDLSNGCEGCGEHYNPDNNRHGDRLAKERHVGDLGNIKANDGGRAKFRFTDKFLKVHDIIGRSIVIHENQDDFVSIDGNSGKGVACAIIARSSGLFQNSKRFCTCDGISIWDERHVPNVGKVRTEFSQP